MSNPLAIVLNDCSFDCAMQNKNPEKVPLQQIKSADEVELTEANIHTKPVSCGCLIIKADDWGRDDQTTNRILECFQRRVLSSASGMVFMEDSERAANIAQEQGLTSAPTCEILRTAYQMSDGPFVRWVVSRLRPSPSAAVGGAPLTPSYPPERKVNSCVE